MKFVLSLRQWPKTDTLFNDLKWRFKTCYSIRFRSFFSTFNNNLRHLYRARKSKYQFALGTKLFRWKYLLGLKINETYCNFSKTHIRRFPRVFKVKSHFWTYFSIWKIDWYSAFFFALVSLSTKKYLKRKKFEKIFIPWKKIRFFIFLTC